MPSNLINRRVILSDRPKGVPQPEHFSIEEVPVPDLDAGEILVETTYWSVDPAMRGWVNDVPNYLPPVEIDAPMRSLAVGTVIASEHPEYATGETVTGMLGWQKYSISDGSNIDRKVTETDLSPSLALGAMGVNGVTAYFGLLDICDPQPGETVVVSTAAGAVGSAVGQIAKIRGCRTVGITSSEEKMAMCRESFGYDSVINYREEDVAQAIKETCPDGVNCYFDNTCGPISDAVMTNLAVGARITVCGTAAFTDWDPIPSGPRVNRQILVARARMQGLLVFDYRDRYEEAYGALANWIREGKLVHEEHILEGLEAAPGAIGMLYRGENTGKLLIKVD